MSINLPNLPFDFDELEPYISQETLRFHYGQHHKGYVEKLNHLILDTSYNYMSLEEIVLNSFEKTGIEKKIFNNAAQAWNHGFFWECLSGHAPSPSDGFSRILSNNFGSVIQFQSQFTDQAMEVFGSGWVWLTKDSQNRLSILPMKDAGNPLTQDKAPLLTCDVWEHAYYLDYQNDRKKFLENYWAIVNWEFIEANYYRSEVISKPPGFKSQTSEGYIIEPHW